MHTDHTLLNKLIQQLLRNSSPASIYMNASNRTNNRHPPSLTQHHNQRIFLPNHVQHHFTGMKSRQYSNNSKMNTLRPTRPQQSHYVINNKSRLQHRQQSILRRPPNAHLTNLYPLIPSNYLLKHTSQSQYGISNKSCLPHQQRPPNARLISVNPSIPNNNIPQ